MERRVKVRRVLEYEGPESWVKQTLERSVTRQGDSVELIFGRGKVIREVSVGETEEVAVDDDEGLSLHVTDLDTLDGVLNAIQLHQLSHPTHGIDCACMDRIVQQVRKLTTVPDEKNQGRVDYVLQAAIKSRR